jgi:hypothetical protein
MGILDLLFKSDNSTTFYQLYNKMIDWKKANVLPYTYNLPSSISFPTDFWQKIVKIQKETFSDGNERAVSIFWADGDLIVSPIDKGDEKSVKSRGQVSVEYKKHPTKNDYLRKYVYLNSSLYKKEDIYYKKVPKKIDVSYLFNMHTHPQHKDNLGNTYYGFFSAQDIKSLVNSTGIITGLITDKLWILIKTNKTPTNLDSLEDRQVTEEYLVNNLNIGVYSGEFYKKLVKLPTTTT